MLDSSLTNGLMMSLSQSLRTGDIVLDLVLMMIATKVIVSIPQVWDYASVWGKKVWARLWRAKAGYRYSFTIKYDKISVPGREVRTDMSVSIHDENEIIINGILAHLKKNGAISTSADQEIFNLCHIDNNKSRKEELLESQLLEYPLQTITYKGMSFEFALDYKINSEEKKQSIVYNNALTISANDRTRTMEFIELCKKEQVELEYENDDEEDDDKKSLYYYFLFKRNEGDHRPLVFKRYLFSTRKTFDTIFFDQKETVLSTIDDFLNKRGAWHPSRQRAYKLFILLYGPPGTGKTSFIKALCNLMKRNPVKVGLDKFNTNEEMLDMFCNPMLRYIRRVYDDDVIRLPVNKRINILEDVDCDKCNHIIRSRKTADEEQKEKSVSSNTETKVEAAADAWKKALSDVTLSGLLNVTDGIYELDGAVAVLTTNDISKFDKALIRPGRMDIILYMGYLTYKSLISMLRMYYGDEVDLDALPTEQTWESSLDANCVTPSDVEALCQYYTTFAEMLPHLSDLAVRNSKPLALMSE